MIKTLKFYGNTVIGNERIYRFGICELENAFRDFGMCVKIVPVIGFYEMDSKMFEKKGVKEAKNKEISFIATMERL